MLRPTLPANKNPSPRFSELGPSEIDWNDSYANLRLNATRPARARPRRESVVPVSGTP